MHRNHLSHKTRTRGFTLVELMIVVAAMAVLMAVAMPSFGNTIRKSRRADAKTALLDLAARQERYLSINNTYADTPAKLGLPGSAFPINVVVGSAAHYQLALVVDASASTFTASAVPLGAQAADFCGTYSLDHLGVQRNANTSASVADCW